MGFTGKVCKFEPVQDGSLTVMLKVTGDQLREVVDQFMKCRDSGDIVRVDSEQLCLPGDKIALLQDILFAAVAIKNRIEKELDSKHKEELEIKVEPETEDLNADLFT